MSGPIDISAPGIKMSDQDVRTLRGMVAQLLDRNNTSFPGAQPVSFCRRHFKELMKEE